MSTPCTTGLPHIWAKSPEREGVSGLSLTEHTWQTLTRLRELAAMRPELPGLCGQPRLWHLLFWAAFLHDWGKAAQGFQKVLRGKGSRWNYRHEVLSVAFLEWIAQDLEPSERTFLAAAIATHHKDFPDLEVYLCPADEDCDPLPEMLADLKPEDVEALYDWLANSGPDWLARLDLDSLGVKFPPLPSRDKAMGLLSPETTRGYLRSVEKVLRTWDEKQYEANDPAVLAPELRPGVLLRGLLVQADHLASAGVDRVPSPEFNVDGVLRACRLSFSELYSHQKQAADTVGHLLLVAPTGSGKTEAALLWAAKQNPPRLFYTLPYQASMNAMYDRLETVFPNAVGLLHGRSTLALYQRLMDQEYSPAQAVQVARWVRNRSGLPYYPVRIFSPYQMLKASFQLKGHEALWSDFAQGAFVFDEIHAYEPRRLAMIIETMGYLARYYGARFLVMSATLPKIIREKIGSALGGALSTVCADDETFRRFQRHRLKLLEGDLLDEVNLELVVQTVSQGAQTLVVANTVRRAQEIWSWMKQHLPKGISLFLLHSRFCGRDRVKKERVILEAAGLGCSVRRPILVVATQVVEVSLNLDFDILFSDPAPLEALLQRFGRVNRLGKRPPAPVCVFKNVDPVFGRIYQPLEQVCRTLEVLESVCQGRFAEGLLIEESHLTEWLDAVYQGEVFQSWDTAFEESRREFRTNFLGTLLPFQSNRALEGEFDRLFDGTEVLPEALYEEYMELRDSERFLEADRLLVPLSWGHYSQLARRGLILPGERTTPAVARVPYDPDLGLVLDPQEIEK